MCLVKLLGSLLVLLGVLLDFTNAQCYLQQFIFSPRFKNINSQSCQNIPWETTCKLVRRNRIVKNCQWRSNCDSRQNKDRVRDFVAQVRLQRDSDSSEVLCCSASLPTIAQKCQSFRRTVVKPINNKYLIRQPRVAQGQYRVVEKLALIQNGRSSQWDLDLSVCTYTQNPRAKPCSRGRGAENNKGKSGGPQQGTDQRNTVGNAQRKFEEVAPVEKDSPRFREPGTIESLRQQGSDPNALDTRRVGNLEEFSFDQLQNFNDFERLAVLCGIGCSLGAATGIGVGIFLAYNFTSCFPITIESVEFTYSLAFLADRLPHLTVASADCISPHTPNATALQNVTCNLGVWEPDPTDWSVFCLAAPCPKFIIDNTTQVYSPDNFVSQASDGATMTVGCIAPWLNKPAGTTPTPLECDDGIWGAQFTTFDLFATTSYCYVPCPIFVLGNTTQIYSPVLPNPGEAFHDTVMTVDCNFPYENLPTAIDANGFGPTQSSVKCNDGTWEPKTPGTSFNQTLDYCYDVCPPFEIPGTIIVYGDTSVEQSNGAVAVVECDITNGNWKNRPGKPTHVCRNGEWVGDVTNPTAVYCLNPCGLFTIPVTLKNGYPKTKQYIDTVPGESNPPYSSGSRVTVDCGSYTIPVVLIPLPGTPPNIKTANKANVNVRCVDGLWTTTGCTDPTKTECYCIVNEYNLLG